MTRPGADRLFFLSKCLTGFDFDAGAGLLPVRCPDNVVIVRLGDM